MSNDLSEKELARAFAIRDRLSVFNDEISEILIEGDLGDHSFGDEGVSCLSAYADDLYRAMSAINFQITVLNTMIGKNSHIGRSGQAKQKHIKLPCVLCGRTGKRYVTSEGHLVDKEKFPDRWLTCHECKD